MAVESECELVAVDAQRSTPKAARIRARILSWSCVFTSRIDVFLRRRASIDIRQEQSKLQRNSPCSWPGQELASIDYCECL
jgi:hypothetical protein